MDGFLESPKGWKDNNNKLITMSDTTNVDVSDILSNDSLNEILESYNNHDVIFVLAGGLNEFKRNHQWVIGRLDLAFALYQIKPRLIICLGGGTYHKPPHLNHSGYVIHESTACAEYLIEKGVHPEHIMREWSSYDTIANAFFSLTNFIKPMNLLNEPILVITSDFHMPRVKALFTWIYSLKDYSQANPHVETKLSFLSVSSKKIDKEIIKARVVREKESLQNLQPLINNIKTLINFVDWFYLKHQAYNCSFKHSSDCNDQKVLDSY